MDENMIKDAVLNAVKDTYKISLDGIDLNTTYEKLGNHSSKLIKVAMYISENLDLEEDVEFTDLADHETLGETVEMLTKKLL